MRPHVPEEELHAYADGELSSAQRMEIAEHLLACLICRAQYGEVGEVRSRTAQLLAIAAPRGARRSARRPAMPATPIPMRSRRPWMQVAAAAAAAVGVTGWLALQPTPASQPTPRLATAFVAPTIFARVGSPGGVPNEDLAVTPEQRTLTLASRAVIRPRVVGPVMQPVTPRRMRPLEPLAEVDPSAGWETVSWESALTLGGGSLARLDGFPVTLVRMKRSVTGGRPTFMVRHLLNDGRSLWVVEGPVDEVGPVHQLLEASGMGMAIPRRALPDYIGSSDAPSRTVRMVTVAGYLPADSLNAMSSKLALK
ncbi:MAG: zf-HC2 domain-containing protein [Gemmatimonadota bacterium]